MSDQNDTPAQHGEPPQDVQGGAVAHDAHAASGSASGTQDAPAMDMHETDDEERIAGIVAQTRHDVGDKPEQRIADVLRQRFADIGLEIGDDRVRALAAEIAAR